MDRFLYVQFINRDARRDLLLNLLMVCLLLNVLFLRVSVCGRGGEGAVSLTAEVVMLLWCLDLDFFVVLLLCECCVVVISL